MADRDIQSSPTILSEQLTRRGFIKGAAIVGATLGAAPLAAACGDDSPGSSPSASTGEEPKRGGTLRVGILGGSSKDTLDPNKAMSMTDQAFQYCLAEGLLGFTPDLKLENRLAEEVTPNTDATEWTVRLKADLVWQDGAPITADDVVFTLQRILDPKAPMEGASTLPGLTVNGVTKVDARTVKLTLEQPNAMLAEGLANRTCMMVPVGFDEKAKPVLCGPFKLKSFLPGQQAVFEPFKDFWRGSPYVDELTLIEFADPAARVNALLGGSVDAIAELPAGQQQAVMGASGFEQLSAKSGAWVPFCMRIDQKPFDDVRVRQAFRLIVDRQQMLENAYAGIGWIGNDIYSPFDPGYPADLLQRTQDLEQAKSLLKQAGYDNDLTLTLFSSDGISPRAVAAAQVFAEQAKGAGVTVNVNKVDPGLFYGDKYLSYTFSMDIWNARGYLLQAMQGSTPDALYNECHWEHPEWYSLVTEAVRTGDEATRNDLVRQAATIEFNEGGYIIPGFTNTLDAYSSKLGGVIQDDGSGIPLARYRLDTVYFK
ncbi:MAG: ABC transporter substrate-binding protein [Thermoleophilia bacterium]